jgi:hypothetical protein
MEPVNGRIVIDTMEARLNSYPCPASLNMRICHVTLLVCLVALTSHALGQIRYPLPYPPKLPDGKKMVTATGPKLLEPGPNLREGVAVAETPPKVDFLYYPGQNYPGNPWSFRAVGLFVDGKYISALCDHLAPKGTAKLFSFDPETYEFTLLVDTAKFLREAGQIPESMDYSPGEVQTQLHLGSDGWLYYGTTRGSTRVTNDEHGFKGEWVLRTDPQTGETEVVKAFPVQKHCILAGVLDPVSMVYYGGTAAGDYRDKTVKFFALNTKTGKVIKETNRGFDRYAIFAPDTGCVYWEGSKYDPATNEVAPCDVPHVRCATVPTEKGLSYGVSHHEADLFSFNTRRDQARQLGTAAVASQQYIASMHIDPSGRYLYYVPGAHGGATKDGTPIVQYDVKTNRRKVLCFLHETFKKKCGYFLDGCFCSVLSPEGDKLYVSWDGWREGQPRGSESGALTIIHIPEEERAVD